MQAGRNGRALLHGPHHRVRADPQRAFPGPGGVDLHAHVQCVPPGIRADACEVCRFLRVQAQAAQQAVPVGLGFIGRGGRMNDIGRGPAGIAVVGQKNEFVVPRRKAGDLENIRRGNGGGVDRRRFPAVDQQAQAPGALALQKNAFPGGRRPVDHAGNARLTLVGVLPGQPGHDGIALMPEPDFAHVVQLPLPQGVVGKPDALLVQRAGQPQFGFAAGDPAAPYTGKIKIFHVHSPDGFFYGPFVQYSTGRTRFQPKSSKDRAFPPPRSAPQSLVKYRLQVLRKNVLRKRKTRKLSKNCSCHM